MLLTNCNKTLLTTVNGICWKRITGIWSFHSCTLFWLIKSLTVTHWGRFIFQQCTKSLFEAFSWPCCKKRKSECVLQSCIHSNILTFEEHKVTLLTSVYYKRFTHFNITPKRITHLCITIGFLIFTQINAHLLTISK